MFVTVCLGLESYQPILCLAVGKNLNQLQKNLAKDVAFEHISGVVLTYDY